MAMDFDDTMDGCFSTFGAAATYIPLSGPSQSITVIISGDDQITPFNPTRIRSDAMSFDVRKSEVDAPAAGEQIVHNAVTYKIKAVRLSDEERLVWKLDCYPA